LKAPTNIDCRDVALAVASLGHRIVELIEAHCMIH